VDRLQICGPSIKEGGEGEIVIILFRLLTTLAFLVGSPAIVKQTAAAMDFSIKQLSDGDQFVFAKGEIVAGDAERCELRYDH